jgi:hypothetical protein
MSGPVTWVATRATDYHWAHGVRSISEEAHDSKLREPPYENEAEPHLAGRILIIINIITVI